MNRDEAIQAVAAISGAPYEQVRAALDRFLDSLLKFNHDVLRDLGVLPSERKARRRQRIVRMLNKVQP